MTKPIKIGVIGLGRIGKVHCENLVYRIPEADVTAVMTPNQSKSDYVRQLSISKFSENADDIFENENIEAVIICSPTPSHFEYIEKAAKSGKHIFCEKPLDMTVSKIEEALEIVKNYGVKLQIGFQKRFDSNYFQVRKQVLNGKIGEPHILRITSRDPAPPPIEYIKSSGGLFMDMTIHDFDMARFIVGSEVTEVFAKGAVLVDENIGKAGDIDTGVVILKFENGCLGIIENSRKAVYGYDQRLEIFGSEGMSQIGNVYPNTEMLYDKNGRHTGQPLDFFMTRYTVAYCEQMRAFVKAIQNKEEVTVSAKDALAATQIALAANESLEKNSPVTL